MTGVGLQPLHCLEIPKRSKGFQFSHFVSVFFFMSSYVAFFIHYMHIQFHDHASSSSDMSSD